MLIKKKDNSYLIQSSNGIEILYNRYLVPDLLKCCSYLFTYWLHLPKILLQVFVFIYKAAHTKISETYTLQVFWATRPKPAGSNQCTACSWHCWQWSTDCSCWRARVFLNFSWISRRSRLQHNFFCQSFFQDLLVQVNIYVIALYIANAHLL